MAPVSDVEGDSGRTISKEDYVCPVCLEIFVEPVTLPCSHTFCKGCFLESVAKATLCCPLCRKRVSTWTRQNSRNKTLVNERLWRQIQTTFPQLCERRLSGQETEGSQTVFFHQLSEPGAVRQEYEDQVSKLTEEKRLLQEQEHKASEEYIQRLLAEEEQLLQEQQRRHKDDERLAQLLSKELNSTRMPRQQKYVPEVTPVKKKLSGQIDRFLSPVLRSPGSSTIPSFRSNKENIQVQMNTSSELPELDYYPPKTNQSEHQDMDQPELKDLQFEGGVKRTSSEVLTLSEEEEETQAKRSCQSSCLVGVPMAEWEVELQKRRKQEEEDHLLALMLQRELDQQQQRTNRRKGSIDAYFLRGSPSNQPSTSVSTSSATNTQTPIAPKPHTQTLIATKPHTQTPIATKPHTQTPIATKPHTQTPIATKPHTQTPIAPKPHTQRCL